MTSHSAPEIERVYLLDRLPDLPPEAVAVRLEQGYLPPADESGAGTVEGRIRRAVSARGDVVCTHTIKRGLGLVREETERTIEESEWRELWPLTAARRLSKTRYSVPHGDLTLEIDEFNELDLVLAEVELPAVETSVTLPPWLAAHVVREVTEDPSFRNYELARRAGLVS